MKLECQSCLLQFDAVGAGPDSKCPRCGSTNVKGAGAAPAVQTGPASGPAAIAATIAQPMVAPVGAPGAPGGFNPVGAPAGGAPFGGAPPSGPGGGGGYGAPSGGGAFGAPPSGPAGGAPFGAPPSPYGAPPPSGGAFGAPQPAPMPYGAPQPAPAPYGAPPSPYGAPAPAPMGSPFGQPAPGFGAAPMGMVAVTPYGNAQVDAEQRKAMVWAIVALLFCWPAAIGAFVQYSGSQEASRMGDYGTALAKAKSAQMWGMVPTAIFGVIIGLACIGGFFGALAGA
ncbi:MAG: CD225/dispanin family protein [Myxococcales bacterium]|nr:CD225/dispanin family protein [Myxococcales bacterium]